MLGKMKAGERGNRGWLNGITDSMEVNLHKLQAMVEDREGWHIQFMGSKKAGHDLVTEQQ